MNCIACKRPMEKLANQYDGLYLCICSATGTIIMSSELHRVGGKASVYLSGPDQQELIDSLIRGTNRNIVN